MSKTKQIVETEERATKIKVSFEEPKSQFVEPKLTKQGDATKITANFSVLLIPNIFSPM